MKVKTGLLILIFFICQICISQDFRFGKVSKEELMEKEHPLDPSANAAILYREISTHIDYNNEKGFELKTDVFERIKIYNKEGFDWANVAIEMNNYSTTREDIYGLRAYTYYMDGKKIEEEKLKNNGIFKEQANDYLTLQKFTMPNVKEGCIIEYKYTLVSPFLNDIDTYRFQENIPINKIEFNFRTPEYIGYKMHQRGTIPFDIKTDVNSNTISSVDVRRRKAGMEVVSARNNLETTYKENSYSISKENIPAIQEEVFIANIDNYSSSLDFELAYTKAGQHGSIKNYSNSWDDVLERIYDSPAFGDELKKTGYFDDDIDTLLASEADEEKKMFLIFEFVKNKMTWDHYNGFYVKEGVKDAYKKGTGNIADINLMLTAMFRYAGLNANPVLISTRSNGIPLFPTTKGFNYVISALRINDEIILFDASNKNGEANLLETKLLNWQGRIFVKDKGSVWIDLYTTTPAIKTTMVNATINDENSAIGNAKNRFTGYYSLDYRDAFKSKSQDDKRKELENTMKDTELSNVEFENLTTLYQPVNLSYDFETFDAVEEIGDKLYFSPMLFLAAEENPFKVDERNFPIQYDYPVKDRYIYNIEIPEGYKVESLPENINFGLDNDGGYFKYLISQKGNNIQLSVEFSISTPVFSTSAYPSLKKFYQLLIDKENEKVVLTKV